MAMINHTFRFWALAVVTAFLVACCAKKADAGPKGPRAPVRLSLPKSAIHGVSVSTPRGKARQDCYRVKLTQGSGSVTICKVSP